MGRPRIALIHALEESVGPARTAFADLWSEAQTFDLLDTSLASDLAEAGKLSARITKRLALLADYAWRDADGSGGTRAILFTCSAFGPAIDAVKASLPIPVLRPNEAAFETALDCGDRIGLIVTFEPSRRALESELQAMAAARGRRIEVEAAFVDKALAALKTGEAGEHDRLVAEAAERLKGMDAVIIGQFSAARACAAVKRTTACPVITTPGSAVEKLRRLVQPVDRRRADCPDGWQDGAVCRLRDRRGAKSAGQASASLTDPSRRPAVLLSDC